jgi:uncharacterized protein
MSGMILHLDEFEHDRLQRRRFEASAEEAAALLKDTGYRFAGGLVADLEADLVGTTIRVTGEVDTTVEYECGRCLETRQQPVSIEAEFVLMSRADWDETYEHDDEIELEADDMDVSFYEGEDIDLTPLVREAILLELPTLPRCPDDRKDECDEAYRRNVGDEALEKLEEAAMDQRWAPLKDLKLKD